MVMAQLKKISPATRAFYSNVMPTVSEQGTLEVQFPAESDFAFQAAQKEANANNFAMALARAFGRQVPFMLRQAKPPVQVSAPARAAAQVPGIARPAVPAKAPSAPFSPAQARAAQQPAFAPAPVPAPPAPTAPSYDDAPEPEFVPYDDADAYIPDEDPAYAPAPSVPRNADTDKMADFFAAFGSVNFEQYE